jgi:hypothetical protein
MMNEDQVRRIVEEEIRSLAPHVNVVGGRLHLVRDLRIDSDDLSFILVPNVEARCGVTPPTLEWANVTTVDDVVALIVKHLKEPQAASRWQAPHVKAKVVLGLIGIFVTLAAAMSGALKGVLLLTLTLIAIAAVVIRAVSSLRR